MGMYHEYAEKCEITEKNTVGLTKSLLFWNQ